MIFLFSQFAGQGRKMDDSMLDGCPEYDSFAKYVKHYLCIPDAKSDEGSKRCVSVSLEVV